MTRGDKISGEVRERHSGGKEGVQGCAFGKFLDRTHSLSVHSSVFPWTKVLEGDKTGGGTEKGGLLSISHLLWGYGVLS